MDLENGNLMDGTNNIHHFPFMWIDSTTIRYRSLVFGAGNKRKKNQYLPVNLQTFRLTFKRTRLDPDSAGGIVNEGIKSEKTFVE